MTWWRPARELRACYGYWFLSPKLMSIDMSVLASKAIYAIFNLCPVLNDPANDNGDTHRW